jgi:hypothetical protein
MSLLELFDKEINLFLPSDVFAILNLITTSKTVNNAILHIHPKVDVNLANRLLKIPESHLKISQLKCDILLSIESFSKIIQKLSNMFIIDTLNLQDLTIQTDTVDTLNLHDLKIQKDTVGQIFKISYFDVIPVYCKSLRKLYVTCYSDENISVRKFMENMPKCKVYHFHKEYGNSGYNPSDNNCFYSNGLKYYNTNIPSIDNNYRPTILEIPDYEPNHIQYLTKLQELNLNYTSVQYLIKKDNEPNHNPYLTKLQELNLNYTSVQFKPNEYAPEKIILKNIDNIKRVKKLNLNAQRSNNKFNKKSWFNKR